MTRWPGVSRFFPAGFQADDLAPVRTRVGRGRLPDGRWQWLGGLLLWALTSCQTQPSRPPQTQSSATESRSPTQGDVLTDGISEELTRAIAQLRVRQQPKTALTVGTRSTEESVQAFCQGQVQLIVVSRPLSAAEESLCRKNSVEAVKFPLGYAAVAAIASPDARWLTCLTPAQLKQLDQALAKQQPFSWQQIDANYPALDVQIISSPTPTTTQLLQAKGYTALAAAVPKVAFQTAQNTLLESVGPVGFVGLHQATQLEPKALLVPIRHASSGTCVMPSEDAVLAARYTELTRPLLAYISAATLESNSAVQSFLQGLLQAVQYQAAQRETTDKAAESASASSPSTGPELKLSKQDPALATFVPISSTQAEDLLNELK